jgi:hypothetical protein
MYREDVLQCLYRVQIVMACTQFQNLFAYLFPIIFMHVTRDAQKNLKAATAQFCHAFKKDFQPLEAYVKLNFHLHVHQLQTLVMVH